MRLSAFLPVALIAAGAPLSACTGFCVSNGRDVLFGNNEDYHNPLTKLWFVPGGNGTFGRVYVGFGEDDAFPQGGMNERGLVFDMFSTPPIDIAKLPRKPGFKGNIIDKMMAECETVEQVISLFDRHSRAFMHRFVMMVADASGDAVAIEADAFVRKKGLFQVQTNFYQSRTKPGEIPCERYKLAAQMLEKAGDNVSVDVCRRILAAVHQEGTAPTLYSNVYDLKRRVMYLYHFHNYENVVRIDLAAELAKGRRVVEMASLFPRTIAAERYTRSRMQELRKAEPFAVKVDPNIFDDYTGVYEVAGTKFTVLREAGGLMLEAEAVGRIELTPASETRFFVRGANVQITFVRTADGKVRELIVRDRGRDLRASRARN